MAGRRGVNRKQPLHVLFYKGDIPEGRHVWTAHCLEFDLVAGGKTINEAFSTLKELIQLQFECWLESINAGEKLGVVDGAPKEYWEAFEKGITLVTEECKKPIVDMEKVERAVKQSYNNICETALMNRRPAFA